MFIRNSCSLFCPHLFYCTECISITRSNAPMAHHFQKVYFIIVQKKIYPYFQYKVISKSKDSFASKSNN